MIGPLSKLIIFVLQNVASPFAQALTKTSLSQVEYYNSTDTVHLNDLCVFGVSRQSVVEKHIVTTIKLKRFHFKIVMY